MMPKNTNYTHIATPLDLRCSLPVEIIPGYYLRKADDEQSETIRSTIKNFTFIDSCEELYECKPIEEKRSDSGTTWRFEPLERKDWRYFIVQFSGTNEQIGGLQVAANLLESELRLGLTFLGIGGFVWGPSETNFFNDFSISRPRIVQELREQDLKEWGKIYTKIKNVESNYPSIKRTTLMLNSLNFLSFASEFNTLGLFAIIESLISHRPKSAETGDSLGHQVRTKIPLLSRRFDKPIDYNNFFDTAREDTVWKTLYDYRSNLAHGEESDFNGTLKLLKDQSTAKDFLRTTTKALLRHALIEPQLYMDLREC